ncbi:GNAT family N-acetyltransferase [Paenarthrobacter sp. NyZ202]|uniref:GNAT family N-acetyltransferase n=1 Tax=Paenarthrobacter sp. NyZ202 TaxID=3402689 RepID=UPI003CE8DDCF
MRPVLLEDAHALADLYTRNAAHLSPWEPRRDASFYSLTGQKAVLASKLEQFEAGSEVPWVITLQDKPIGMATLTGIVRGPFLSANLGYWVDYAQTGNGVASAAVSSVAAMARDELGLHRVQAGTLLHNVASQRVLKRNGFDRIGVASAYLCIAGTWQDHVLYQRILF